MPVQPSSTPASETSNSIWPGFGLIEACGPDAQPFLQSQLSSDVNALALGGWQWSAWLSAKGRVTALMLLLRQDERRYWMLLPDHPAAPLASALQRFVLRRKLELRVLDELIALPCFEPCGHAAVAVVHLHDRAQRSIELLPEASTPAESAPLNVARWLQEDIRCGVPRLSPEGGTHTAHMLSLDRLQAASLTKGCYPGQEIVARTHYLGQSKRRLGALIFSEPGTSAPHPGAVIARNGHACGEVLISARCSDGRVLMQTVMAETAEEGKITVEGCEAHPLPLAPAPLPDALPPGP